MRGLTIQQPYAWLFTLPADDPRRKRIENRGWGTDYRGPVLIHAGKSDDRLYQERDITDCEIETMALGAVVARGWLIDCVSKRTIDAGKYRGGPLAFLNEPPHRRHVEGPVCHVIGFVEVLPKPIPWPGKQSYWLVPAELEERVIAQLGPQKKP